MAVLSMDFWELARLQQAMKDYQGNTEEAINEVLHKDASELIQKSITRLMPTSNREWKGKIAPAKTGKALTDRKSNLAITVTTKKKYQYLYFPDDGSNTRHHAGNQQFFAEGAELQKEEITNRCINRLVDVIENAV